MDISDNQIQILERLIKHHFLQLISRYSRFSFSFFENYRTFKVCLYPDEIQRADLGRELGVQPQQIKFWFKNRLLGLTAWQARDEQVDNHLSDSENDEIDSENDEIH
ncbi:hypothetical protein VPH35_115311 [Triticum aestivum]